MSSLAYVLVFFVLLSLSRANVELDVDFDRQPGINVDTKVLVAARAAECFHQYVHGGATVYISFQVLRGGDRDVLFYITNPIGENVLVKNYESEGHYENTNNEHQGVYSFCFDNTHSYFHEKMIYFFVLTFKPKEWEEYAEDVKGLEMALGNFTSNVENVNSKINLVRWYFFEQRRHLVSDWYLLESNRDRVTFWSIVNSIVVMATAAIQVIFIRRFFNVPKDLKTKIRI